MIAYTLVDCRMEADLVRVNATGKFMWHWYATEDALNGRQEKWSKEYPDAQVALDAWESDTVEWQV